MSLVGQTRSFGDVRSMSGLPHKQTSRDDPPSRMLLKAEYCRHARGAHLPSNEAAWEGIYWARFQTTSAVPTVAPI